MSIEIKFPEFHNGQVKLYNGLTRFSAICAGRRFGKTTFCCVIAADYLIRGKRVGLFVPSYKYLIEFFREIEKILAPIIKHKSKSHSTEIRIETTTGGLFECWSLKDENAGRSRKYHLVIIDEAGFTNDNLTEIWPASIRPTLLDYAGHVIIAGTPKGANKNNFFYKITHDPEENFGFSVFSAPASENPMMTSEELGLIIKTTPPLVFRQEYLAEWVDWSGTAFFYKDKCLVGDLPVEYPEKCDAIFCVVDTAVKTGTQNDGSSVIYFALNKYSGYKLIVLDWEILQIEGAMLETWIPSLFYRSEELAKQCNARNGFIGCFIEDKSTGMVLLQQGKNRGWPTFEIDSKLTSLGKDERCINASGYVFRENVKISKYAYEKRTKYKQDIDNHFMFQVFSYVLGDKEKARNPDDLLDCFCYGVLIGCGNAASGF